MGSGIMLSINQKPESSKLTLELVGRLDTSTAPELEAVVRGNLDGVKELIFDIRELEYVSSAGLRVFLSAQKIMNKQGSMLIKNVSKDVMEVFEVTGFSDILTIE